VKLGVKIRIIDKAAMPGTTSRAIAVHARTLEFYRQVGVAREMVESGIRVGGVNLWGRGAKAFRLPIGNIGEGLSPFPFVLDFPQDIHERFLIEHLSSLGVAVERETELVTLAQADDRARCTLRHRDGSQEVCEPTFLAGCDGAHSDVRGALGIGFPGGTYEDLFYVADVEASGPCIDKEIHIDLDYGQFVGVFPYPEAGRIRLIGTARPPADAEHRELTFDDVKGHAIEHMRITISKVNWFSTYKVHHRVANHFQKGRCFLLGDAAHIHSPVGAQGMNTGIGDSVNLAWKLAAVLNAGACQDLLASYESERIAFARRLIVTTDRAFTFVTAEGDLAQKIRLGLIPRIAPWIFRPAFIRRLMFRTVSQIGIQYREGPLSEGKAGTVQGGDRLPWIQLSQTEDNFAALASLSWQVHVYGEPRVGIADACEELQIPLHQFPWKAEMEKSGLARDAAYLIRPDGYVGLADPDGEPENLGQYFVKHGLSTSRARTEASQIG
jgi:2-polyprenyl-6-methoxyphenol hydroxylase-like FAD-dependent oxidoreductase